MTIIRRCVVVTMLVLVACKSRSEPAAPPVPAQPPRDAATEAAIDAHLADAEEPADAVVVIAPPSREAGAPCTSDADCAPERCYFTEPGCSARGTCGPPPPNHECYVAIPMCRCRDHASFFGAGGCSGQGVTDRFEAFPCPCTTDADCGEGQRCEAPIGPHRPGTKLACNPEKARP